MEVSIGDLASLKSIVKKKTFNTGRTGLGSGEVEVEVIACVENQDTVYRAYLCGESKESYPVGWVLNSSAAVCMRCDKAWSLTNRRHHCRACGDCICHHCSAQKVVLPNLRYCGERHRVCNVCALKTVAAAGMGLLGLSGKVARLQRFSRKLMIFLSSTFTDTHSERNVILKSILKDLRALADPYDVEVSFVDMRYGVRDESTLKHMTWEECKRELKRCHEESAGIFFLSLQGSKYG